MVGQELPECFLQHQPAQRETKMDRRLYAAAGKGNVDSLLQLLEEDPQLLDRFITDCYSETPLHIASIRGHVQIVQKILQRKPELATVLDSRGSSPLHLATANGYLEIVKILAQVKPDMCYICDEDGRNSVHIAALEGHLGILERLLHIRPGAARILIDRAEPILHACVRHNQLEALKVLLETVDDRTFVNFNCYNGNTVLHIAVAHKQIEVVKYLVKYTAIKVNSKNADGLAALDLLSQNRKDFKAMEIAEILEKSGARNERTPLSKDELEVMRKQIFASPSSTQIQASRQEKYYNRNVNNEVVDHWYERKRNSLMVVASLIATMAFQGSVTPPGGLWQDSSDGHKAGFSVLAYQKPHSYSYFLSLNTTGLVASLSIILLLVSGLPLRHKVFMWVLTVILWVAITAIALTYLVAITAYTPGNESEVLVRVIVTFVFVWVGLMLLLLIGHTIRLIYKMVRLVCPRRLKYSGGMRN